MPEPPVSSSFLLLERRISLFFRRNVFGHCEGVGRALISGIISGSIRALPRFYKAFQSGESKSHYSLTHVQHLDSLLPNGVSEPRSVKWTREGPASRFRAPFWNLVLGLQTCVELGQNMKVRLCIKCGSLLSFACQLVYQDACSQSSLLQTTERNLNCSQFTQPGRYKPLERPREQLFIKIFSTSKMRRDGPVMPNRSFNSSTGRVSAN